MNKGYLFLVVLSLTACSSMDVKQESAIKLNTLFSAKIIQRKAVAIQATEKKSERVIIGLVTGGVVGAIATANTEKDFSKPKAFEYLLQLSNGEERTVTSRSINEVGQCVSVLKSGETPMNILLKTSC